MFTYLGYFFTLASIDFFLNFFLKVIRGFSHVLECFNFSDIV